MSIGEQITGVFTDMGDWIIETLPTFTAIFWLAESGLTIVGWLSVAGLGMGAALLLFNTLRGFFRFS